MPRTKVSKNSKRNREAAHREEKIRDFETSLDGFLNALETKGQEYINEIEAELSMLLQRTGSMLLQMKVGELLDLNLNKFSDWSQNSTVLELGSTPAHSLSNIASSTSLLRSTKVSNPNDEGYLTEDSTNGGGSVSGASHSAFLSHLRPQLSQPQPQQQQTQRGRTPGPLSSARARRRSRSACADFGPGSALKPKLSSLVNKTASGATDRTSRSKMRTPVPSRTKAFSADRTPKVGRAISPNSPATAILRWPKPGEIVLSTCGSPVVAQILPEKFANVNIPVRNGVLSLRPKKIGELKADIIDSIDAETLSQIKTLHANLDLIMTLADKTHKGN